MHLKQITAGQWCVIGFSASYTILAAPYAWLSGNSEFLFYIVVMLLLMAVVGAVHLRVGLSTGALACLSLWGMLHMAGGLVPVPEGWPINGEIRVLYSLWIIEGNLKYDQLVHAFGFGVTTWVVWQCLRANTHAPRPTFGLMVACAAAGMGFGALNEVVEFIATLLIPETNVGGYTNTGWDLVANATGATTAAVILWVHGRRK